MAPRGILGLFVSAALVVATAGCGGSSSCSKACKRWSECLPNAACPLSAECTAVEACEANCIKGATCEAITGADAQAAQALQTCRQQCRGVPPSDGPPPSDGAADGPPKDQLFPPDHPKLPDQKLWPDQFIWPDTKPPPDMFVWPDTYSGVPFGCVTDFECMGKICCKTPWGVKLCADTCPW
jgi:hypothetical protein